MREHRFLKVPSPMAVVATLALALGLGGVAYGATGDSSTLAPGAGNVQGYEYINATFTNTANNLNFNQVFCPNGKHVTGGGVAGNFVNGQEINQSYPVDGPDADTVADDGWGGGVNNTTASSQPYSVYAICRTPSP